MVKWRILCVYFHSRCVWCDLRPLECLAAVTVASSWRCGQSHRDDHAELEVPLSGDFIGRLHGQLTPSTALFCTVHRLSQPEFKVNLLE